MRNLGRQGLRMACGAKGRHGTDSKEKNGRESVFLAVFCCVMTCGYGKMKKLTEQSGEIQWQGKVTV